jgi:WD domain, G-beta repeat
MSENTTTSNLTADGDRFPSLTALRKAHSEMLKLHREKGTEPEIIAKIEQLVNKGQVTGTLLDSEDDRWAAQSLLDYWTSLLYRAGQEPPDTTLADFDPSLAPDLIDDTIVQLRPPTIVQLRPASIGGDRTQVIGQLASENVVVNSSHDVAIPLQISDREETQMPSGDYSGSAEEEGITKIDPRIDYTFPKVAVNQRKQQASHKTKIKKTKPFPVFASILIASVIVSCMSLFIRSLDYNKIFSSGWLATEPESNVVSESINARYSPNGNSILTIDKRTARLWNLQSKLLSVIGKEGDTLNAIFSPDSKLIATTEPNGDIRLWDYKGREKVALTGNKSIVTNVAFSPDGKLIAAASSDKNISLWNIQGTLLSVRKEQAAVVSLMFSPDGKSILTANKNGVVHRWNLFSQIPDLSI